MEERLESEVDNWLTDLEFRLDELEKDGHGRWSGALLGVFLFSAAAGFASSYVAERLGFG
jgi:hypothetical protein